MKWILFAGLGFVALIAVVAIVGSMLPRAHVASRTLRLKRTPEEIWPVVTQVTSASSVPVDLVESDPPRRLVTRVKDTEKMFGGTWTIVVTPLSAPSTGSGQAASTLTITEDGWVANPIFRFVSRYIVGHHGTLDGMLRDVAKRFNEEAVLSGE